MQSSRRYCPVHDPFPDVKVRVVPRARWFVSAEQWQAPINPNGKHRRSRGEQRFLVMDAADAKHALETVWARIEGIGFEMDRVLIEVERVRYPGGFTRCETVEASR